MLNFMVSELAIREYVVSTPKMNQNTPHIYVHCVLYILEHAQFAQYRERDLWSGSSGPQMVISPFFLKVKNQPKLNQTLKS